MAKENRKIHIRMVNKLITIISVILIYLCLGSILVGCSEKKAKTQTVDGFEKAEYEKYNSSERENELVGEKVYVEGKLIRRLELPVDRINGQYYVSFVLEDKEDKWIISIPLPAFTDDRPDNVIKLADTNEQVRVFGQYAGYLKSENAPLIVLLPSVDEWYEYDGIPHNNEEKYVDISKKIRLEKKVDGKFEKVWSLFEISDAIAIRKEGARINIENTYYINEENLSKNYDNSISISLDTKTGTEKFSISGRSEKKEIASLMFWYYMNKLEELNINGTVTCSVKTEEKDLRVYYDNEVDSITGYNTDGSWVSDEFPDWVANDAVQKIPEDELEVFYEEFGNFFEEFGKSIDSKIYEMLLDYGAPLLWEGNN